MNGAIIGLMGPKRSGKDTVANYLVSEYGFVRVAFADPLKELALELDPIVKVTGVYVWGEDTARLSEIIDPDVSKSIRDRFEPVKDVPEVRRLLQRLGVAVRHLDEDFWVNAGMLKVEELWEESDYSIPGFVVPDVRFPNEYLAVADEITSEVWRVERSGLLSDDAHISETALTEWVAHATIDNGGSIADLHHEIDKHLAAFSARQYERPFKKIRENT